MEQCDVLIIGGGIVGLATAYHILLKNPRTKLLLFEKESRVALHQSSRNSGVVHSGIYYKPGSLKAKNCFEGRRELIEFCQKMNIPLQKVSKIIVATHSKELPLLNEIQKRGIENNVPFEKMSGKRLKEIEPYVQALEGISLLDCFITSYQLVAESLREKILEMGAELHLAEGVCDIQIVNSRSLVFTKQESYSSSLLINCAGLFSDHIARMALGKKEVPFRIVPFRGEYYQLREEKAGLVKGLIYPVPDPNFPFLGVHLTRMIDGNVEAGPNAVLSLAREGYRKSNINLADCWDFLSYKGFWNMAIKYWKSGAYEVARSLNKRLFVRDLQRLVPALTEKDLIPGGTGVRAQLVTLNGRLHDDFAILQKENQVHILNAPSPAATASFAIGRQIANIAGKTGSFDVSKKSILAGFLC